MGTVVDPASMNIGWYYNWGYRSFKDMGFKNKKFDNVEFVPMIWGDNPKSIEDRCTYANKKEYKYLLSYNEPDLTWESNQTPTAMINRWRETISYKGSLRLVHLQLKHSRLIQISGGHHFGMVYQLLIRAI